MELEAHVVDGVTVNAPIPTAWGLAAEMEKTLTLTTGDRVIISFVGEAYVGSICYVEVVVRAAGVEISPRIRNGTYYNSGSSTYSKMSMVVEAVYTAVADGDVTFDIYCDTNQSGRYWSSTRRQMILQHFSG